MQEKSGGIFHKFRGWFLMDWWGLHGGVRQNLPRSNPPRKPPLAGPRTVRGGGSCGSSCRRGFGAGFRVLSKFVTFESPQSLRASSPCAQGEPWGGGRVGSSCAQGEPFYGGVFRRCFTTESMYSHTPRKFWAISLLGIRITFRPYSSRNAVRAASASMFFSS